MCCESRTAWLLLPALSVSSWMTLGKSRLTSLGLGFLICKVGPIIVPPQGIVGKIN